MPSKWIPRLPERQVHTTHGKETKEILHWRIFRMKKKKLYLYFSFMYKYAKINRPLPITLLYAFFQLVAEDVEERHPGFD